MYSSLNMQTQHSQYQRLYSFKSNGPNFSLYPILNTVTYPIYLFIFPYCFFTFYISVSTLDVRQYLSLVEALRELSELWHFWSYMMFYSGGFGDTFQHLWTTANPRSIPHFSVKTILSSNVSRYCLRIFPNPPSLPFPNVHCSIAKYFPLAHNTTAGKTVKCETYNVKSH